MEKIQAEQWVKNTFFGDLEDDEEIIENLNTMHNKTNAHNTYLTVYIYYYS